MCVFAGDDVKVTATSILARRSVADRQILVYSMTVLSAEPTAMILPLPVAPDRGEDALRFIDLSAYEGFFDDMRLACDTGAAMSGSRRLYMTSAGRE